jgi:hypothetical protein
MSVPNIHSALERLVELRDADAAWGLHWDDAIAAARAALAQPEGEGGSDYDQEGAIAAVILDHSRVAASLGYPDPERNLGRVLRESDFGVTARASLARWGHPATPPAPEVGEVGELVNSLTLISDGMNAPTDSWVVARAGTLLQQQEAELATLKDDGWAKAMTDLVDQIGGEGPYLWEWGASIPTPKKVVEYLRKHIDYLEHLSRVQGALAALKVDPVAESERPWEREGWCNEKGDFWAEGINGEGIAEWERANRNHLGNWMVRCLPHNAIPLPAPQAGKVALAGDRRSAESLQLDHESCRLLGTTTGNCPDSEICWLDNLPCSHYENCATIPAPQAWEVEA